jgi:hypothetical protein
MEIFLTLFIVIIKKENNIICVLLGCQPQNRPARQSVVVRKHNAACTCYLHHSNTALRFVLLHTLQLLHIADLKCTYLDAVLDGVDNTR